MALAACALGVLAGGIRAAQAAEPQSVVVSGQRATSSWVRAESAHFVVVSDVAREDVTRFVEHLERLDGLLRIYIAGYGATAAGPEPKRNVIYLDTFDSLMRIRPDISPRLMSMSTDCLGDTQGFYMHVEPLPTVEDDKLAVAPLHRRLSRASTWYALRFLYQHTDVRVPPAWIEGFSQYFASTMFGENQMVIGRMPPDVNSYFLASENGEMYRLDYSDVVARDPFKNVPGGDKDAALDEFRAKSWLLAHYILGASERRQRLGMFLNAVGRGGDAAAALRDAFGLAVDDAGMALRRYRLRAAEVLRVEMPPQLRARPEVAITTLSARSGEFALADAVLKGCPARAEGERLLRTLSVDAARVPNVDAGQLALSRAQVGWGDPAAALPWLERAARRGDASADVLVLHARAHLKLAARTDAGARAAHLDDARASLARARERAPGSGAVALAGLELSLLADGAPSREALDAVLAAWSVGRDSSSLGRAAALAWCYLGDVARAEHVLHMLANGGFYKDHTAWAVEFQRRLDAGLSLAAIADEMRRKPVDGTDE
jgi:hypothetical protein